MASKALVFLVALLATGVQSQAPTSAPTAAPTAAPTSAPTFTPTAAPTASPTAAPTASPTAAPTQKVGVTSAPTSAATSAPSPTAAPTAAPGVTAVPTAAPTNPIAIITFATTLTVANTSQFSQKDYLASIAAAAGVNANQVEVVSVNYVVTASYSFAETVTVADVKATVAAQTSGVKETDVKVTLTAARRLSASMRRLATTADVQITVTDPATADAASTAANNATALAEAFKSATGKAISPPTVTKAPSMAVVVETKLLSTDGVALPAPKPADIATQYEAVSGVKVTATVETTTQAPTVENTTTTASAPGDSDEETSSAHTYALSFVALAAAIMAGF
eukprot:TRINITY_DN2161_c0_g1_i10.p1 TRINITY_DN2161_c0_g1~~TRINITY_DN2161_c0_g1_i10.p1  ORF type:complete len:338 (+),score=68.93 TRINITY_DN2161_c0_g1_i10:94-1107(+)